MDGTAAAFLRSRPEVAIVLGTNEIASAVAIHLHRAGYAVVMSHDAAPPVIRRRMAFHDALWGDPAPVEGLEAVPVERVSELFAIFTHGGRLAITRMGLVELMVIAPFALLIDARMDKYAVKPDLRHLADVTIGLGPGFAIGRNCDVAVETHPRLTGQVVAQGETQAGDRVSRRLGNSGAERFVYAGLPGRWHTAHSIGSRVFRGMVLGHLERTPVLAPLDGVLRGLARDGIEVPGGVKLLEIDPRNRWQARFTGMDERGRAIAEATLAAARAHRAPAPLH
ncbi:MULTISPECIES: xanthine dehydrogenase [Azorhizobium]|uniref:xanthine dehydrogenase n=1 Tax=Azorhizobium TaxID=6 RepID=UPI00105C5DCB|nr:xanthine dehydrogenase [Azorhizobium sp. AG788]TDT94807.1 hypothetical protein DFO45_2564 [Azorhizobium sp. AG788]